MNRGVLRWAIFAAAAVSWAWSAQAALPEEVVLRIAGRDARLEPARLLLAEGRVHAVVAFRDIPVGPRLDALRALGVTLHQYLPDHAYFATIPAGRGRELLDLPFVRSAEPVRPEWKAAPELLADPSGGLRRLPGGRGHARVYFFPDTTLEEAREALSSAGAEPLDPGFRLNGRLAAVLDPGSLPILLARDEVRWVENGKWTPAPWNAESAAASRVDVVRTSPYGLTGNGVRVGIMDVDYVDRTHADFGDRVTIVESLVSGTQAASGHATHVTGTILGSGSGNASAAGMAPGARAWTWTFEVDDPVSRKLDGFDTHAIDVDCNSWGYASGWEWIPELDSLLGWVYLTGTAGPGGYNAEMGDLDGTIGLTDVLVHFAVGNEGYDDGSYLYSTNFYDGHYHYDVNSGNVTLNFDYHPSDRTAGCVGPPAGFKDGLAVGSVGESAAASGFSSVGPCADGRVKPDLVAVGEAVLSTVPKGGYDSYDGTSMATPAVTGIAALVVEAWKSTHGGIRPRVDVLKGLLIQGALDLGNAGPDYQHGFGLADALYPCAAALYENGTNPPLLRTGKVDHGTTREYRVAVVDTANPLRVTLCWTDPPGNPAASKALVNDLDLVLESPSGAVTLPFVLNRLSPTSPATRGVNTVDNVERAEVAVPEAGTWKVRVKGTTVPFPSQDFAVWFTHPYENLPPVAEAGPELAVAAPAPYGGPVMLSGAASTDPNGIEDIVSYEWDTDGDGLWSDPGGSAFGPSVQVVLPKGLNIVALRVRDSFGLASTDTVRVFVVNNSPVAIQGPDRVYRASDPLGRTVRLDGSASTDAQTLEDIAAYEWETGDDSSYDDAVGAVVDVRLSTGVHEVGLLVRDTSGVESTDTSTITILAPENLLPHGGRFRGSLGSPADADSFMFEAAAGSILDLAARGKAGMRVTVWAPGDQVLADLESAPGEAGVFLRKRSLAATGWYWVQVSPTGGAGEARYSLTVSVRAPRIAGRSSGILTTAAAESSTPITLLEGSRFSAAAKGNRKAGPGPASPSLELLGPDGTVVAAAGPGGHLRLESAPASGVYRLRVFAASPPAGLGAFDLAWKGAAPRSKSNLKEAEGP